ncbi:neurotensin receptor type 1 [Biomphalaria pfeifferi]|uniref:Neurotensin receptor type 1 n=1 Tax=Biomphalaria pfeifferi TaxID=112525 RepID=A0AAD8B0I7_BIOPF|nr:neurotensin receptor type 1 [Biomphalaria pfeifferi]
MYNETNVYKNITSDERREYLSVLQQESTIAFIPTFVYLGLLAVVGIPGNSLVIIVYLTKMTMKPLNIFIISMAVIDLITCLVILPGILYFLLHMWDFNDPPTCQFFLALISLLVMSSVLMLVSIAIIRYMKMCYPFKKQVTLRQTKFICSLNTVMATVVSIPHGILQGKHSRQTQNPNIVGYSCKVDDSYVGTIWPTLDSALFFLLFLVLSFIVTFCYVRIGCVLRRHGKNVHQRSYLSASTKISKNVAKQHKDVKVADLGGKTQKQNCSTFGIANESESVVEPVTNSDLIDINTETISNNCINTNVENSNVKKSLSTGSRGRDDFSDNIALDDFIIEQSFSPSYAKNVPALNKHRKELNRTYLMMLTVTLVFFLGFLPFLGLNFLLSVSPEKVASLKGWSLAMYQLFLESFLVNCAANPIIYSLMDQKFKDICIQMFKIKL